MTEIILVMLYQRTTLYPASRESEGGNKSSAPHTCNQFISEGGQTTRPKAEFKSVIPASTQRS